MTDDARRRAEQLVRQRIPLLTGTMLGQEVGDLITDAVAEAVRFEQENEQIRFHRTVKDKTDRLLCMPTVYGDNSPCGKCAVCLLAQAVKERDEERRLRVQLSEDSQRHVDKIVALHEENARLREALLAIKSIYKMRRIDNEVCSIVHTVLRETEALRARSTELEGEQPRCLTCCHLPDDCKWGGIGSCGAYCGDSQHRPLNE